MRPAWQSIPEARHANSGRGRRLSASIPRARLPSIVGADGHLGGVDGSCLRRGDSCTLAFISDTRLRFRSWVSRSSLPCQSAQSSMGRLAKTPGKTNVNLPRVNSHFPHHRIAHYHWFNVTGCRSDDRFTALQDDALYGIRILGTTRWARRARSRRRRSTLPRRILEQERSVFLLHQAASMTRRERGNNQHGER